MKFTLYGLLILALANCAYRMGPNQRALPGGRTKIFVNMFENRTQEVGIEADMTNAFIQELSKSGLGTYTSRENADIIIEGTIHAIGYLGKTPVRVAETEQALFTEYQTQLTVLVRAIDPTTNDPTKKELWQGQVMGEKNYKAPQVTTYGLRTANPLYNQSARRQLVRAIAKEVAAEAVTRMTENF